MIDILILLLTLILVYMIGHVHGQVWERRRAGEQERLAARIDPPKRTAGLPTNTEAEPSEIRQPRWRSGHFYGRDNKEW